MNCRNIFDRGIKFHHYCNTAYPLRPNSLAQYEIQEPGMMSDRWLNDKKGEDIFLAKYKRSDYEAPSVAVDLIVFNKDKSKILLINRADHPYVNKLAFPGGFYLQTDDTVEAAATRELVEETSVDIRITEDNLLKITSNKGRDPRGWVISVAYMVLVDEKCIRPRANSDALYANWVNVDSIKKDNMAFDHFEILQYALNL